MTTRFLKQINHVLAVGFGTGLSPKAPGTVGTLVGIPLYGLMHGLSAPLYVTTVVALFIAGVFICEQAARDMGVEDPGAVVFDEIVGYVVTLFLLPPTLFWVVAGFIAFRFFDIVKPPPIRWFEHRISLGFGIMADDIAAGVFACASLHGLKWVMDSGVVM